MKKLSIQKITYFIVSEEYKLIFCNIKKVASSSIEKYMINNLNAKICSPENYYSGPSYNNYKEYFSFAFVRNPLDRLLSCYKNKIKNPNIINEETGMGIIFDKYKSDGIFYKEMSFKEFLKAIISLDPLRYDDHFNPQYQYVCDVNENIVVDFVGKFENIENDFQYLINNKNLPISKLPHLNKSTFNENYDEETTELAKQVYGVKKDMEIFNYNY